MQSPSEYLCKPAFLSLSSPGFGRLVINEPRNCTEEGNLGFESGPWLQDTFRLTTSNDYFSQLFG